MMLLNDEEINKLPKFVTSKISTRPEVVAKAQLKKVVEELRKWHREEGGVELLSNWKGILIYEQDWQSLLEEIDATK